MLMKSYGLHGPSFFNQGFCDSTSRPIDSKAGLDLIGQPALTSIRPPHNLSSRMDIFEEIVQLRKAGRRGALATIIEVQGSIPSHESAKILVRDDRTLAGTVGGGCVEAEVWSVA